MNDNKAGIIKAIDLGLDKPEPHDKEAERTILASAVVFPMTFQYFTSLSPYDFYIPIHQQMFQSLCELKKNNVPTAEKHVSVYMKNKYYPGDMDLNAANLIDSCLLSLRDKATSDMDSLKDAVARVESKARCRRLIATCTEIIQMIYSNEDAETAKADLYRFLGREPGEIVVSCLKTFEMKLIDCCGANLGRSIAITAANTFADFILDDMKKLGMSLGATEDMSAREMNNLFKLIEPVEEEK